MTRPPFDLVEAEEELSGGYNVGVLVDRLRLVLPGRVRHPGHQLGHHRHPVVRGSRRARDRRPQHRAVLVRSSRCFIILFIYVWIRATLPRLRYDQLMDLGWKRLIPASLGHGCMIVAGFRTRSATGGDWSPSGPAWSSVAACCCGPSTWAAAPPRWRAPATNAGRGAARELPGLLQGLRRSPASCRSSPRSRSCTPRRSGPSRSASTAAMSSTATRTAWRSASAASCAPACARPVASTSAAPTTRPTRRSRRASATASCTRSTSCAASTATCASRPARPRPSPSRSCSSSPSPTARTPSTPRPSCSSTTRAGPAGAALGGLEDGRRPQHLGVGAGHQPGRAGRRGGPAAVVGRARLRRAPGPEGPERSRPRPTFPPTTDLSLREMASGALRGVGVRRDPADAGRRRRQDEADADDHG